MNHKHLWIALGVGVAAGFYLAAAQSGTGIYGNSLIGQTAANIWTAGNNLASGTTVKT